ncbi:MAG: hypothetical protein WB950_04650, partial [Acidobacteriaceae bacterium]
MQTKKYTAQWLRLAGDAARNPLDEIVRHWLHNRQAPNVRCWSTDCDAPMMHVATRTAFDGVGLRTAIDNFDPMIFLVSQWYVL